MKVVKKMPDQWRILTRPTIGAVYQDNGFLYTHDMNLKVYCHPLTGNKGEWVNSAPYSKFVFEVEPFGQIELPSGIVNSAEKILDQNNNRYYFTLYIWLMVDVSTGDGKLGLSIVNDISKCFYSDTKRIAIDLPVHQSVQDAMSFRKSERALQTGAVNNTIGFLSDIASLDVESALKRAVNAIPNSKNSIDSATMANQVSISGSGTVGSYMSFVDEFCTPKVHCYFQDFTEEFNEDKGRPLCKKKVINTLSGFIKCEGASIETDLTQDENNMILEYLNGGFFYE